MARKGLAAAADGSVYVTGGTRSFSVGDEDAFLLNKAANADAFLAAFAGTVTEPAGAVGVSAAMVTIPAGSETFAGSSDAFLLRIQP